MKKALLIIVAFLGFTLVSNATKHIVMVSNNQFSPQNIPNVFVGDTIRWQWVEGSHTTTCDPANEPGTELPNGAPTWDKRIRNAAGDLNFEYKVTVAGFYRYYCSPHAPGMQGTFTASVLTPIKLISFGVNGNDGKIQLDWKTENEINTEYFLVRRSTNGSDYTEIAQIPAKGNATNENRYSYNDLKVSSNQKYYYYNIAIVDKDGKKTFSDVKYYKNAKASSKIVLTLSPNPISRPGHLNMTFNAEKQGKLQVRVVNSDGKTILNSNMSAYPGVNNGHVHLGELPAGTYSLICTLDGVSETHKILFK